MKRTKLCLIVLAILLSVISLDSKGQTSLDFRYANPTFIIDDTLKFQFDVQIKAGTAGTQLFTWTIRSNFNNSTFVNTPILSGDTNMRVKMNSAIGSGWTGPNVVPTVGGTFPNKYWTSSASKSSGGYSVPTDWVTLITVILEVTDPCGLAGLNFIPSYMQGRNRYRPTNNYTVNTATTDWTNQILGYTVPSATTWNGSVSSNWLSSSNWTGGVPCSSSNVTIGPGSYPCILDQNVTVNNLTITDGGQMTVPPTKTLTVGGTLLIQTGGSLIQDVSRPATVERYIPSWGITSQNLGWHFLSSPVNSQAIQPTFVPNTPGLAQDFYMWDEGGDVWVNSRVDANNWNTGFDANFEPGKGYLASYQFDGTKQFIGNLNNTNISEPVTNTGIGGGPPTWESGWNLLGNPFSSAISGTGVTNANVGTISGLVKIWSGNAYTDVASGVIPAMNGFMVQTTLPSGSVTIPLTARVHDATSWYKESQERILLVARNAELPVGQESVVRFDASATDAFDASMDGHFLPGYAPMFYSQVGEEKLSTNTLPSQTWDLEIPFGFAKNEGNSYVIEMKENIADANVFLTDLKTGQVQNLTQNPVYNFTAASGDAVSRFVLKFSTVGVEDPSATNNGIYTYGDKLYVNNPGNGVVEVYSMTGQLLASEKTNTAGLYVTSINASTGYYLVRVISATSTRTAKVFVK
jgi:hypothetical protein